MWSTRRQGRCRSDRSGGEQGEQLAPVDLATAVVSGSRRGILITVGPRAARRTSTQPRRFGLGDERLPLVIGEVDEIGQCDGAVTRTWVEVLDHRFELALELRGTERRGRRERRDRDRFSQIHHRRDARQRPTRSVRLATLARRSA
jgi:hypothetical protein